MVDKKAKKPADFLNVDESEVSSEWAKKVVDGVAGGKPSATKPSDASTTSEDSQDDLVIDFDPGAPPIIGEKETSKEEAAAKIQEPTEVASDSLHAEVQKLEAEKNQYLETSRRIQAEFENYRKQVAKREVESRERANEKLVTEILPVLDACDGAISNGSTDVTPIRSALIDMLNKQGLEAVENAEEPFDPELHEAVMHEDAKDSDGPVVAEVLRVGYKWKGRLIRPAMVKVRG